MGAHRHPQDDITEDDLLVGTKLKTGLQFPRTVDPSNGGGKSREIVLEFEIEFADWKLSGTDIRKIQTSKNRPKALVSKTAMSSASNLVRIPISSACYASSSKIGEKLKQEGQEDVISFLPLVLVLNCFGRRGPDHGYNLSRPLDPLDNSTFYG
jgi:hypothetical protein